MKISSSLTELSAEWWVSVFQGTAKSTFQVHVTDWHANTELLYRARQKSIPLKILAIFQELKRDMT